MENLEFLKLTPKEFVERTGLPKSTVYNWTKSGKLRIEKSLKGSLIVITQKEIDDLVNWENLEIPKRMQEFSEVSNIPNNPIQNSHNFNLLEILEYIEPYHSKAAKYELLEDRSKELKDDVAHWQEEYFKLKYENEQLTFRNNEQSEKIDKLQKELDEERKKSFFKKILNR